MGLIVRSPPLAVGEIVQSTFAANMAQESRVVGGRLFVSNKRLIFEPHRLDRWTGGEAWSSNLDDIAEVQIEGRSGSLDSKGIPTALRRRLRISEVDGRSSLFLVHDLERRRKEIWEHVRYCRGAE